MNMPSFKETETITTLDGQELKVLRSPDGVLLPEDEMFYKLEDKNGDVFTLHKEFVECTFYSLVNFERRILVL